jgi:hypothetical protein
METVSCTTYFVSTTGPSRKFEFMRAESIVQKLDNHRDKLGGGESILQQDQYAVFHQGVVL